MNPAQIDRQTRSTCHCKLKFHDSAAGSSKRKLFAFPTCQARIASRHPQETTTFLSFFLLHADLLTKPICRHLTGTHDSSLNHSSTILQHQSPLTGMGEKSGALGSDSLGLECVRIRIPTHSSHPGLPYLRALHEDRYASYCREFPFITYQWLQTSEPSLLAFSLGARPMI